MTASSRTVRVAGPLPALGLALLLAGCGGTADGDSSTAPASHATVSTTGAATDRSDSSGTATLPSAAELRTGGSALTAGDLTVHLLLSTGTALPGPVVDEDGAATVTVDLITAEDALWVAPPEQVTAEALSDGGVLLRGGAGTPVAALSSHGAGGSVAPEVEISADGAIGYYPLTAPAAITVTLASAALRSATWADRDDEGGQSLAVVPTTWARGGGLAAEALLWAQLVAAEPSAETPGMHDQLSCHQVGAPEKDSWNLEPWRPEVGLVQTMLAACNPS